MNEFKVALEHAMTAVKKFEDNVRREGINLEELAEKLTAQMIIISEQLNAKFSEPLPEEITSRQKQWEVIIDSALSKLEDAVVSITALWGVSKTDARAHFEEIKLGVKTFLVVSGEPSLPIISPLSELPAGSQGSYWMDTLFSSPLQY